MHSRAEQNWFPGRGEKVSWNACVMSASPLSGIPGGCSVAAAIRVADSETQSQVPTPVPLIGVSTRFE